MACILTILCEESKTSRVKRLKKKLYAVFYRDCDCLWLPWKQSHDPRDLSVEKIVPTLSFNGSVTDARNYPADPFANCVSRLVLSFLVFASTLA